MTEQEWMECCDLSRMLKFVPGRVSWRKVRLFTVACCRRVWHLLPDERSRRAVEVGERFADGRATKQELAAARQAAYEAYDESDTDAPLAAVEAADPFTDYDAWAFAARDAAAGVSGRPSDPGFNGTVHEAEVAVQRELLRDIVGPPAFRRVEVTPAWVRWNDGTVCRMAESIYEERVFDRLPVLADALEDAGCSDKVILGHLRSPGAHVRGCWVIDLLLGKE